MSKAPPGGPVKPKRTHLELTSGRYLDYTDPQPEDICVDDIAHALGNTCRWGGHCPHFYSVAEHACLVHDIVARYTDNWLVRFGALHHDDHEAFVGDVPTPLKNLLGDIYYDLTGELDSVIWKSFGFMAPSYLWFGAPEVKEADALALFVEAERFKVSKGLTWAGRPDVVELPAGVEWACGLSPAEARQAYLARHRALVPSSDGQ